MAQNNFRVGRLEQEIQKEVNNIFLKRLRDPRLKDINITGVRVTGDLQQAKIFYSSIVKSDKDEENIVKGLDAAKGLIRKELGRILTIYKTPEITFSKDNSIEYGSKIDQLINELNRK